jgi:hypothetical protein
MAEHWKTIRSVNTEFETDETSDKTVITLDTSPTRMPVGWVNFLKQRFHVLGIDYKHVGSGRIVVTSTPRAAESVVKLVDLGTAHGATGARLALALHVGGRVVHVRTRRNPAEPGPDIPFEPIGAREFGSWVV